MVRVRREEWAHIVFLLQQDAGITLNFPAGIQTGTLAEVLLQQVSCAGSVYIAELKLPTVKRSQCYSDSRLFQVSY